MTGDRLAALRALVGDGHVLTDEDSRRRAAASWYPPHMKAFEGRVLPAALVRPADGTEVAAVVRWANDTLTPLVPVGGGSNTVGSNRVATPETVTVSLERLDEVTWDEESLLVTAGAGCNLGALEEQLNGHDYTLGQHLGSLKLATVGGVIASNAVGLFSGRYGRQSDLTASLEVVLPTSETLRTDPAPGADAYFGLHELFIGTEGQFGIVTAATLRMRPVPEVRAYAPFAFKSWDDAADAARLVCRSDARPAALRVFDAASALPLLNAVGAEPATALLLMAFEGEEQTQTGQYQLAYAVCQQVGGEPRPAAVGDAWFDGRQQTSAWSANGRPGTVADVWAFSAPWSVLKDAARDLRAALGPHTQRLSLQLGHPTPNGAAVEATVEAAGDADTLASLRDRAVSAWRRAGGWFPHHYGVGAANKAAVVTAADPAANLVLARLKKALDPNGILNPLGRA